MVRYSQSYSDIRIGAIGGISSGSVTSLKDMRRAEREPWQRTTYDLPPATVHARHRELVAKTVRHAREAVEEMLRPAEAQPEHMQELDAYLSVAHAHVRPVQAVVAADTAPTPAQLQEVFLQITAPLVAGAGEDSGDGDDEDVETETRAEPNTALPAYLAELPLFAAAT